MDVHAGGECLSAKSAGGPLVQTIVGPAAKDRRQAACCVCCAVLASWATLACGQGSCDEVDNTRGSWVRGGGSAPAAVLPGTGPCRRSPGSVSSRRPTAAAAGSEHWQIQGSVHVQPHGHSSCTALQQQACGRRAPGEARGSRGCDCAADGGTGQLLHPRCGSPPDPPHRRQLDSVSCSR
jgi:hypothetical protein